jgi:glutamate synthase (NADPH/NADH) small chain
MGKPTGFIEFERETPPRREVAERIQDFNEIYAEFPAQKVQTQAARCMDCGLPFCHSGCPVNNVIPHWNDLIYRNRWKEAIIILHSTNNFPEFTGRICPAPCEAACVLGITSPPVSIKAIERSIVDHAFQKGWIRPERPAIRTGKRVAVIGSGPSGLAAAQQLNRAGHHITVYEKNDRLGGLLRYGIPDFKLEKHLIDRRIEQMQAEGVVFTTRANVGGNISAEDMKRSYDALVLCGGSESPRDLRVPGRELKGIHFAMEFLPQQNRRVAGDKLDPSREILATGKNVVIIGGGDTGADCLGTSIRQGAKSIRQLEIMPRPPDDRSPSTPWPLWPYQLRSETSHEEGGVREWAVSTVKFEGDEQGNVRRLHLTRVGPPPKFEPIAGTEFTIEAGLVLIAMGFVGPTKTGLIEQLGVGLDNRGNVATDANSMSTVPGVFSGGDMRRGQSLVVWAISEGRKVASSVDRYLMGESALS